MLRIDREWCPIVDTLIAGELPEKELLKLERRALA
jgi:RNA polymerase-associated protein